MKYLYTTLLCSCLPVWAVAQITFYLNHLPAATPPQAEIFITGDFENWTGGQNNYRLTALPDGDYAITLPQQSGSIEFKFTRGSWDTVEKGTNGEEISNRSYTFGGNGDTIYYSVLNWADLLGGPGGTASSSVSIVSNDFPAPQLNTTRRIWIYLPPGYSSSNDRYPVLYMHDAQNLFDVETAFSEEWEVDESLDELYTQMGFELIVVGIDNGGASRIDEYTPFPHPQYGGGNANAYLDFLVTDLKPYIDSHYRTRPEPGFNGLMGSSLGGLVSHYGALRHPDVFAKAGVFSPSFWFNDQIYFYAADHANISDSRMYFMCGDNESTSMVGDMEGMIGLMQQNSFPPEDLNSKIVNGGTHNEWLWRQEFKQAVLWLFAELPADSRSVVSSLSAKVYPNPTQEILHISPGDSTRPYQLELYSSNGSLMTQVAGRGSHQLRLVDYFPGVYYLRLRQNGQVTTWPIVVE